MKSIILGTALLVAQSSAADGLYCENVFKDDEKVVITASEVNLGEYMDSVSLVKGDKEIAQFFKRANFDSSYRPQPQNKDKVRYNLMQSKKVRSAYSLLIPKLTPRKGSFLATFVEKDAGYHRETEYTRLECNLVSKSAETPCENYAKYGAIREYRRSFPGSGAISATAKYMNTKEDVFNFFVTVEEDTNEGADDFTRILPYQVAVQMDSETGKCVVKTVNSVELP